KGPANGSAALVVQVVGKPVKIATSAIGPDGALHLVVPAAAAAQYARQPATIEVMVAGKPVQNDAKVTITPGLVETARLPLLPDAKEAVKQADETPKPRTRVAAVSAKKDDKS